MAERIQYELGGARTVYLLLSLSAEGRTSEVKEMIEAGVDVNALDYDKRSALHLAASEGRKETVEALISLGADVNAVDRFGGTPLRDALEGGRADIAAVLRQHGGSLGEVSDVLVQKVCHGAATGNVVLLENVYENSFLSINAADYDNRSPLHVAAGGGHKAAVEYLLRKGANPRAKDRFGNTAIDEAAREGHQELSDFIASYQADAPAQPSKVAHTDEPDVDGLSITQRRFVRALAVYIHAFATHTRKHSGSAASLPPALKGDFSVDAIVSALSGHGDVIKASYGVVERRFAKEREEEGEEEREAKEVEELSKLVSASGEEARGLLESVLEFVKNVNGTTLFDVLEEKDGEGVIVSFHSDVLLSEAEKGNVVKRRVPYDFEFAFA